MKRLLIYVGLWTVAGIAGARASLPPNIVFILIDDLGWADGGCFGSKFYRTPNINKLAASGMRFTQAYAACAVCSPTRAAIMTGKFPARLHITDWIPGEPTPPNSRFRLPPWRKELPLEEITLAEMLKSSAYATACFGKWHLGGPEYFPEHQGFDLNIAGSDTGSPASYFWPYGASNNSHRVPGLSEKGGATGEYLTDRLTDEALTWIEHNKAKPFFLYLAHYAVHAPLMGKRELVEQYSESQGANGQSNSVYAAMVQSVDESVGRILAKLDQLGLSKRTIVVFTSDNGGAVHFGKPPATSNAPLRLGKGYAYEGGLRVPLIVKAPGVTRAGSVSDVPVASYDFFPTLLELADGKPTIKAPAIDGRSFVSVLKGKSQPVHREFFWHYPHYWNRNGEKPVTPYSVARLGDWKLVRFYETAREELYNLHDDPVEQHDLAATEVGQRRQLSTRLDEWLKDVGAQMPIPR